MELMFTLEVAAKGSCRRPSAQARPEMAGPSFEYPGHVVPAEEPELSPTQRFKPLTMKGQPAPR
jgi:hypothetical protein